MKQEHMKMKKKDLGKEISSMMVTVRMIARDSMDSDCRGDPAALMDSTSIERNQLIRAFS